MKALATAGVLLLLAAAPASVRGQTNKPIKTVLLPSANPLVAIRLYFSVGAAADPKGKEGLCALTAAMLGKGGTKQRTYAQVLEALYPLAARIGFHGDKESMVFSGTVHKDNLAAYADLLAAQVLAPRFAEEDFRRNRQEALDHVTKTLRGNDDEALGKQALGTMLFAGHPYGHPTRGTEAGLQAITLEDVKAFHARNFTRSRLIVGLAGGYPADFPAAFIDRFQTLPAGTAGRPARLPAPVARRGPQVLLVEKDAAATAISIGHPLRITRADPDFYPLTVARSYLGEHRTFNGVLMNRMRGLRGLNYGDYAYIENFIEQSGTTFALPNIPRRQQHFEIWLRPIQHQNALFALRQAIYETDRLIREGIPQQGFEDTRRFLLNYSRLWTQDASRRLGFAIDGQVYGKELVTELARRLPTMTKADVDRAIRKHLSARRWAAALVTSDAEQVRQTLAAGTPTPIVYDTPGTAAEVLEEDKKIQGFPLSIDPRQVRIEKADAMFKR